MSVWYAPKRVHDHIAIVPRALAESYFSADREVSECVPRASYDPYCHVPTRADPDVPMECLLTRWLARADVPIDNGALLGSQKMCLWRDETHTKGACSKECAASRAQQG